MKILDLIDNIEILKNMLSKAVLEYTWLEFELESANKEKAKLKEKNEELQKQLELVLGTELNSQTKNISVTEGGKQNEQLI